MKINNHEIIMKIFLKKKKKKEGIFILKAGVKLKGLTWKQPKSTIMRSDVLL